MAFRLKSADVQTLHRRDQLTDLAGKLKAMGGTESEREERDRIKARIKEKVLSHGTTTFRWCFGNVLSSGLQRRVNGQHSSEVFLELTAEEWRQVRFPIVVIWEEYECDTIEDLPSLFEQFDPTWSSRNKQDLIGAHMGIHEDLRKGVSRYIAEKATAGISWYASKVEGNRKTGPEFQFSLVHDKDASAFLLFCGTFLQRKKTDEMTNKAVMAAMYHTATDDDIKNFWRRVAGGKVHLDADSVEYKLSEFLEMVADPQAEWPRNVKKHFNRGHERPDDKDIFATCLNALSSYLKGRKIGEVFTPAKGKSASEIAEEFTPIGKAA